MEAGEYITRLKKLRVQAEVNSKHKSWGPSGPRWKIVADLVDKVITSAVLKNLTKPEKNNQPPQY
tara:strand:- start:673 stop:867 length:195 start_codon:yes stop_codon:yes gene_type:complete